MVETKVCRVCGKEKPITDFHKNGKGYRGSCSECTNSYRNANPLGRLNRTLKEREYTEAIKSKLVCSICGEPRHYCLSFHHIDPSKKEYKICKLFRLKDKSKLMAELEKCMVVCQNCHLEIHYKLHEAEINRKLQEIQNGQETRKETQDA